MLPKLLIATHNLGKVREYRELLVGLPVETTYLDAAGITLEVEETGASFAENALLKATTYAAASGLLTWADDSGLEVDALDGAPGVYSARYAGHAASDADRYRKLLNRLAGVPWDRRTARFRCVVAIAAPHGAVSMAEGVCEGIIAFGPAGEHGFGYDQVFFIPEFNCTMAQMDPATKNRISHRARAMQAALPIIQRLFKGDADRAG